MATVFRARYTSAQLAMRETVGVYLGDENAETGSDAVIESSNEEWYAIVNDQHARQVRNIRRIGRLR